MLGYPDKASALGKEKDDHARQRGNPFDLGFALTTGSQVLDYRCEPDRLLDCAEEAEKLGRMHSIPFISEVLAQLIKGVAWLTAGRLHEAIVILKDASARWTTHGVNVWMPYFKAVLGEGVALSGDIMGGLSLVGEALDQIDRPGWQERVHLAEVLRLKGWMLLQLGNGHEAEWELRASLDVARKQNAKSWELRTSTTLAELLVTRGEPGAAHDLLAPIYNWFTEGFDTRDLREAKALLEELR